MKQNTGGYIQFKKTTLCSVIIFGLILGLFAPAASPVSAAPAMVKCRVETDRAVLPAGGPQNVVIKITLDAPRAPAEALRPMVNVALVLDRSGSMNGTKMRMAKEAATEALTRLGRDDVFSLVVYDTHVDTIVPAQKVRDINAIIRTIRQIRSGGSTALFGGVSQGAAEIRKHIEDEYVHRVVLLSDGLANVGPSLPGDLGRLGAGLFKENISVTTVGVGTDYNEDLMAQLAQKSDGNTYFVESGVDLPRIFAAELGEVLNVVAKQVTITVTLPGGVEPVDIIGREGRIKGNKVELSMNQLYGGQEKYALIEVRLPAAEPGSALKVARADVAYQDAYAGTDMTATGIATAKFSSDPDKVSASTNLDVVRDYQLNLNALAQEKAIELSDQGNPKAAAAALRKSAEKLKEYGGRYQDEQLMEEAQAVEIQADSLETEGMSKKSRKELRTKSYQMKNQQMSQ
ncbi:MAG: VWA domain-containing protein [Desulfobacterales bacterium]|nr:VWA domain-containing protein [Desulfobacterales bacterium]